MLDLLMIALLQAAAGDPAPAEATPPPAAAQQPAEQAEGQSATPPAERRRCRNEAVIGSRMTQRVCTTASEDRQAEEESRRLTERAQSQMPLQSN